MHVPALVAVGVVERDEAAARLAQPPRGEQLLAQTVADRGVAVARARIFARQIEGLLGPAQDQVEGLPLEGIQAVHQAAAVHLPVELVEAAEQMPAISQAIQVDRQVHVVAGLAADIERSMRRAQPVRAVGVQAGEANVGGDARCGWLGPRTLAAIEPNEGRIGGMPASAGG